LVSLWSAMRDRGEDRELEEEMRFHIDSESERLRRSGMSAAEARRRAYVRFGGVERMRERTREARGTMWLETLWTDLRVAHRSILRTPGQSLAAVLTLGLGIGVATTQFGTLYAAFYRTLPFDDAEHFVWIWQMDARGERRPVPVHDFVEWRDGSRSLRDLGADWVETVGLRTSLETWQLSAAHLTWNSLDVVGAQPVLGRAFAPEDDRPDAPRVALVSQRVWEERFDADPATIGRQVAVNGEPATIIGVMPEGFQFPMNEDLWLPLRVDASRLLRGEGPRLQVFGHLDQGVSADAAQADISRLAAASAIAHPETNEGLTAVVYDYLAEVGPEAFLINWMLMVGALAVLLIACVNVANLLLARAAVRTREVALRSALGARRLQIMLHVLAESVTLGIYGSLLGAALGWVGVSGIAYAMSSVDGPYWMRFEIDGAVLLFTALAAAGSGIVTGLLPALRATAGDAAPLLKDGSRGSTGLRIGRLSRALVGVEVAFSVAVLVAAGLMSRSVVRLAGYDLPFRAGGVLVAGADLFAAEAPPARRDEVLREALDRLQELPGVQTAALARAVPGLWARQTGVEIEGVAYPSQQDVPRARFMSVSPDFFELLQVAPVSGRTFSTLDDEESLPVAIVNESFARAHFSDTDPVGRQIRVDARERDGEEWRTVVGVVPDLLMQGLINIGGLDGTGVYVPTTQSDGLARTFLLRAEGAPVDLTEDVRSLFRSVDPDLGVVEAATLNDMLRRSSWYIRITAQIFIVFGVVALFLACVGLGGVVAFESERRTREVGVRVALGARARDVAGLIVGQGVRQVTIGIAVGLLLAIGLARGLVLVMFETDPNDPLLYVGAGGVVLLVSALASLYPAIRAARSDPVRSLQAP
jgi:putative ABC transport system permease protein